MAYVKTIWLSGEIISAARLNHIEDGIYQNSLIPVITVDSELDPDSQNPVENAAITDRFLDLENDMSGWGDAIRTLSGNVSDLALDVETGEDNIEEIQGDVETLDGSVTSINNSIGTINQNLTGLNQSIGTINQNVTALSGRVTAAESNITALQTTVAGKLDPDDVYPMFAKTEVTESITVNANAYNSKVGAEFTKAGYFPLAIMGYDFANTVCFPVKMSIADPAVGSGKVFFGVKNTSGSAVTFDAKFYILWIKTS